MKNSKNVYRIVLAALFLALAQVLPLLTGQIPSIGNAISPMHFPVLLCGFFCGPVWGLIVGFASPLVRFVLFGMPPLFPKGLRMAFELAGYGLSSGLLYRLLPKKPVNVYLSLIGAMLFGRLCYGLFNYVYFKLTAAAFSWAAVFSATVLSSIPGLILQILLIPVLVLSLEKAFPSLRKK